jgi:hypothetical protein
VSYDYKRPFYFGLGEPLPVTNMYTVEGAETRLPEIAWKVVAQLGPGKDPRGEWLTVELENHSVIEYHTVH